MPWNGYNFEDSILISERIVRDDVFTSIHLEEFEVMARDTKLGPEEITRDIPNVGEEALRNLDEAGIVAIGAEVLPGDILVGKVTPKGESPMTPEEKLLRAIFGEKASDVRDTSLRLPPGVAGTVVEVRVFNRHGVDKDERAMAIERAEIDRLGKDRDDEFAILNRNMTARLRELLVGRNAVSGPKGLGRGEISETKLDEIAPGLWWQIAVDDEKAMGELESMRRQFDDARKRLDGFSGSRRRPFIRKTDSRPRLYRLPQIFSAPILQIMMSAATLPGRQPLAHHDAPATWFAVAATVALAPGKVLPLRLGGQSLVLWRTADGVLALWEDRCPHRGMRLSFGAVHGDTLLCPYHGWTFGSDGACRHMPAHPDLKPSRAARPRTYAAAEAQGFIWGALAKPDTPFHAPAAVAGVALYPVRTMHLPFAAAVAAAALSATPLGHDPMPAALAAPEPDAPLLVRGVLAGGDEHAVGYVIFVQPADAASCGLHLATLEPAPARAAQRLNQALVRFRLGLAA